MGFDLSSGIGPAADVIKAVSYSQQLISNNVANAQTPGYVGKSVDFADMLAGMNNPYETQLSRQMGQSMVAPDAQTGPVDLQKELIKMQFNYTYFGVASRRLTTVFNNLRTASQVGR